MSLVSMLMTGSYTVTRMSKGTYIKGEYQAGEAQQFDVMGSLQPTNARELKLPEEGNRLKQYFKFYTDEPVFVNNTKTLADSDKILINGESFKVISVESWAGTDIPYFMSIVYREPEQ
jgi:NADH:ubiquinone oxidoreductase subunit F (NADH-binding)